MTPERVGAFIEYVIRPMTDDIRIIVEKLKELNLPLTEPVIRDTAKWLAIAHWAQELLRAATYIVITGIICRTVILVAPVLR